VQSCGPPQLYMRTYLPLAGILLFVVVLYRSEAAAYFCGFDDMNELHRIGFTEHPGLADDFSTMPYLSYKYRPLTWTINRVTYELGHASPIAFRTRNLIFHLLNIVILYAIAMLLFGSAWVAWTAALLFGIHPLVNQSLVGAVWTVTPSDFLMLLALLLFLLSVRSARWWLPLLAGSLFAGWLGILAYDAVFFFFGLPWIYLAIQFLFKRKRPAPAAYFATLILLTVLFLGSYFNLRSRFLPPGAPHSTRVTAMLKNTAIYAGSFTLLIDPVLANEWFDTPLPSAVLRGGITPEWLLITLLPAFCIGLFILIRWTYLQERIRTLNTWPEIVFLLVTIAASFSAFLLFTDHASETYVYLPVAFFVLLMSRVLCHLCGIERGWSLTYAAVVAVLVILFGCAVWVRNGRVIDCGSNVSHILTGLPKDLAHGPWHLLLADAPYEPGSELYGMYGYKGVESLGVGDYGKGAVQGGLQAYFKNGELTAEVVSAEALPALCEQPPSAGKRCFWIHSDGRISPGETAPQ
jgi:hypothetical protein